MRAVSIVVSDIAAEGEETRGSSACAASRAAARRSSRRSLLGVLRRPVDEGTGTEEGTASRLPCGRGGVDGHCAGARPEPSRLVRARCCDRSFALAPAFIDATGGSGESVIVMFFNST